MKILTSFFAFVLISIFFSVNSYSQIVERDWGGGYNDNMRPVTENSDIMEYDIYIYFLRIIENKFADKGSDYTSIPSIVYTNIWVQNVNARNSKIGYFELDGVRYDKKFENAFKESWEFPNPIQISPASVNSLQLKLFAVDPSASTSDGISYVGDRINLSDMSFPQYYIIADAPSTINVKSENDFTVKVANAKSVASAGFVLPLPDVLNLYFYTLKLPNHKSAFKTPVTTIPQVGGTWFSYDYLGKHVKSDYESGYFNLGEGAVVVKSAKSYPVNFLMKNVNMDLKCLVTFVNIAQKTYDFVP